MDKPMPRSVGGRVAVAMLSASLLVFAGGEKDKDKKKGEAAKEEGKHEQAEPKREKAQPAREDRRREAPEPRADARHETPQPSRQDSRRELPQSSRQEPSREAPGRPAAPMDRVRPAGRGPELQVVHPRGGGEIQRTPSGAIREIHTPGGVVIRHSPSGVRHVEVVRPGGRLIVSTGAGRSGYVQRPLVFHGQSFVQRTYVHNGVAYARVYRPWSYGGREYHIYAPTHYYHPSFYTWIFNPWARPISYRWGWYGRPWYGYYGGYFSPYPVYVSPAFWLADFIVATTLESAYLAQNASAGSPPVIYDSSSAMSPEAKQAIADEVRRQMEQNRSGDPGLASAPPALFSAQGPKVFMVSGDVMANSGNQECPLVEGDVLQLVETPAPGSEWARVRILASRGSSCPRGSTVFVGTVALQEMQNHMEATREQGMDKLQYDQGKDGIP